ncbi:DUF4248 domain-containing protein [Segatella copri]|uniref:DUF4248 domain-containing protein n=1 Tax=Segatella copri TaxID=165179 RepID=UPI003B516432
MLGNSASEIFFYLSEIFPYLSEGFSYDSERFYSTRQKKEATDKNRLKRTNYDRRQKLREGRARHALLFHRYPRVALNRLVRWINRCPELKQSLCSGYASKFSHFYTRQQVAEIIEFLDEP